jgi:hypothetical protein
MDPLDPDAFVLAYPGDAPPILAGKAVSFRVNHARRKLDCDFDMPDGFAPADLEYALGFVRDVAVLMGLDPSTQSVDSLGSMN